MGINFVSLYDFGNDLIAWYFLLHSCVVLHMLSSSMVDREFDARLVEIKDNKITICCKQH
jgi:hypothetical protein